MAGENTWDAGYHGGGNYWSTHTGDDRCSGRGQNTCPDPDGIGDAPFPVDNNAQDRFPLMESIVWPEVDSPIIAHDAPVAVAPRETVTIQAFVADAQGVDRVMLHYKGNDREDFVAVLMNATGNHRYQAEIKAPAQVGIIEYYIQVFDARGNITLYPKMGEFLISVRQSTDLDLPPLLYFGLASVAAGGGLAYFLLRRRRRAR